MGEDWVQRAKTERRGLWLAAEKVGALACMEHRQLKGKTRFSNPVGIVFWETTANYVFTFFQEGMVRFTKFWYCT